jgi:hypothetical protein
MPFSLVLCRPHPDTTPSAIAAALLDPDGHAPDAVLQFMPSDERERVLARFRAFEPRSGALLRDGEDWNLPTQASAGINLRLTPLAAELSPVIAGSGPRIAEALFARARDAGATLASEFGLICWSPELKRVVDLERDHEVLVRAWLAFCTEAAAQHIESTRRGGSQTLVAGAVMIAVLLAIMQTPSGGNPWLVLIAAVGLPLLVLLGWRLLLRRRRAERE